MQIGLIGAGNMATALARGWGEPVLVSDLFRPRAEALVAELGGEVVASNAELARARRRRRARATSRRASSASRRRSAATAKGVISILGGVPLSALQAAYGGTPGRADAAERAGRGAPGRERATPATPTPTPTLQAQALELFGRVGPVVTLDESEIDVAMGLMSCAPAYVALIAEAQIDAGVRAGLPADVAGELVGANLAGTAALLQARDMDTLARAPRGHLAGRLDGARPRRARARRPARGVRRRDAGGARRDDRHVLVVASAREQIADFLGALFLVYIILIFAYILLSLVFSFGGRVPYSRWSSAVLGFLRDVSRAVPRAVPALHPADRPARHQPDRRDPRAADRRRRRSSASSAGERDPGAPSPAVAWTRAGVAFAASSSPTRSQGARRRRRCSAARSATSSAGVKLVNVRNTGVAFGQLQDGGAIVVGS